MSSHCFVVSSFGSRRPEEDKQWLHERLHAYVNSHVRQIGASSPNSNCSINVPPVGRTAVNVSVIVRLLLAGHTGAEAVNHVGLHERGDCLCEDVPIGFGNFTFL